METFWPEREVEYGMAAKTEKPNEFSL